MRNLLPIIIADRAIFFKSCSLTPLFHSFSFLSFLSFPLAPTLLPTAYESFLLTLCYLTSTPTTASTTTAAATVIDKRCGERNRQVRCIHDRERRIQRRVSQRTFLGVNKSLIKLSSTADCCGTFLQLKECGMCDDVI